MLKKRRILPALLCALCLLTVSCAGAVPNIRGIRNVIGRIEQGSIPMLGEILLIPQDCSGFELQYRADTAGEIIPGLPAPETDGESGMLRCPLDEETARMLFENAYAVSVAPDGSMLRVVRLPEQTFMVVQREKTFVLLAQSGSRGAPDTDGTLKSALDYKLKISPDAADGEVRWSPDSRYLFFNDSERWRGAGIMLDDPYLADTQTGEIFLIENGGTPKDPLQGTFRCVMNGRFSMDGKSFYWYCRSYAPDALSAHYLMRYDLADGTQETVCELNGAVKDFCEVTENRWFVLESADGGTNLVRLTVSPDEADRTEELLPFTWDSRFLPVVRGNVLLAADPLPSGGTYLLPLTWDGPASASSWRKIGNVRDDRLQEITPEEIDAEIAEANSTKVLSGGANIGTAYVKHAAAVIGVTDLILTVFIREPVPDCWGGGFNDFSGQIILNTENLTLFPILAGGALDGLQDSLVDAACFLMKNYGWDALGLYSVDTFPEVTFLTGETYTTPYGNFMCRSERNPLILTSVTLENRQCEAEITAGEDRYSIRFRITDLPEPETVRQEFTVPEALTESRWEEIRSILSKKDQKKFVNLYTKISPDKLEERTDRDEILAAYPAAAAETLYILKDGIKAYTLESTETLLADAGYTAEDYAGDMALAASPRETNVVVTKQGRNTSVPVRYVFLASGSLPLPESSRILELAGLCDRIARTVLENRLSADPLPPEDVIADKYDMISADFYVTVDDSKATGNTLEFSLTVTP